MSDGNHWSGFGRRELAVGLGSAAALAGLGARPARAATTIKLLAWNYQVDTVQGFIKQFEVENPDIAVDAEFVPSAQYIAKVTLERNAHTKLDVLYVFDNVLSQWSNWLQPLDGEPGAAALRAQMLPLAQQSMTYQGKLYGLPYYTSYFGIIYNEKMATAAGFSGPPKTYAEWLQQAQQVQAKGLSKAPLLWPVKYTGWGGMWVINAMVASLHGKLLDADYNVTKEALQALQWWTGTYKSGLSSTNDIGLDPNDSARAFMSGDYLSILTANFFAGPQWANDPKNSKIAGSAKLVALPETGTTVGFARMYSMNGASQHKAEAWRLLNYLGGKDKAGNFATPAQWVEQGTLTWGYKGVETIPAVASSLKSWGADPADVAANLANAEHMSKVVPFQAVWYTEWETYANGVLQDMLGGRTSPEDGAKAWSARAKALAAHYR